MNNFYIEFRDPLFSIIIFFLIIFLISFFSYWWGRYKQKESSKNLDRFLKQFSTLPTEGELKELMQNSTMSEKSWLLLASSYTKNGDYEKTIEIYTEIIKSGIASNYKETMFLLGQTYFKAGFLQKSKDIFLKILQQNPRTTQALNYLLLVYEYMKDYKSALEVLEPLKLLEIDVSKEQTYLEILLILEDTKLDENQKADKLLEIYNKKHIMTHLIFEYIFSVNPQLGWNNLDTSKSELLLDVLWQVKKKDLDFDIISKNGYLRELYSARGDFELTKNSDIFEFDILINLDKNVNATLSFEYVCESCKQVSPFVFNRCGYCHEIDSARVEINLTKDYYRDFNEESNSFL